MKLSIFWKTNACCGAQELAAEILQRLVHRRGRELTAFPSSSKGNNLYTRVSYPGLARSRDRKYEARPSSRLASIMLISTLLVRPMARLGNINA